MTPLHYASIWSYKCKQLLIDAGADVNVEDEDGLDSSSLCIIKWLY